MERVEVFKPLMGVGPVSLREFGKPNGPLYHIGNTSELKLVHDESVVELPDNDSLGGGTYAEVRRVNSVTASFTMHDLNADNLALATRGKVKIVAAGSVTDEAQTAHKGATIRLTHPKAGDVVVTGADGTTPYNDYELTGAGIKVLPTGDLATAIDALSTPSDGLPVLIDYTHPQYHEVQPMTAAAQYYELVFDGMNEADSGNPVIVDVWKLNPGILNELALKSDDFASAPIEGKCLKDPSKGAGESAYYRIQQV